MRPLLDCNILPGVPFYCEIEWQCQAVQCIREATEIYDLKNFGYELLMREKLSRMWYLIVKNMQSLLEQQNRSESQDTVRINAMLDFLHQHYAEPLKLQQVAATANISKRECLRCFQKTIRMTPIQYLLTYRVSVSARLLTDTDAPSQKFAIRLVLTAPAIFPRFLNVLYYSRPLLTENDKGNNYKTLFHPRKGQNIRISWNLE